MLHHLQIAVLCLASAFLSCPADEWPQFHGAERDNMSPEKGLLKQWPTGGPSLLWTYDKCGGGYAGVAVMDDRIFIAGDFGTTEKLLALDMDGKLLWTAENGDAWKRAYPGARTTPTVDDGKLYHMNPVGRLGAFEAETGEQVWAVDLRQEFGAKPGTWAMAENVVVVDDMLLCAPGGPGGGIVALDKATGKTVWANTEIGEGAAYCSPAIVTHNDVRQYVTILQTSIVSVDVKTGKLLWSHLHETKHGQNVTMPIPVGDGKLFASSGHGTGGRMLRIASENDGVEELWLNKDLDNCHGGVALLDGHFYGSGCRLYRKGVVCVNAASGETTCNNKGLGKVSITYADGMLYCLNDRGRMSLVSPSPSALTVVSQFDLPATSRHLTLCHPVVCGGRMYLREWNNLLAYDIRAGAK